MQSHIRSHIDLYFKCAMQMTLWRERGEHPMNRRYQNISFMILIKDTSDGRVPSISDSSRARAFVHFVGSTNRSFKGTDPTSTDFFPSLGAKNATIFWRFNFALEHGQRYICLFLKMNVGKIILQKHLWCCHVLPLLWILDVFGLLFQPTLDHIIISCGKNATKVAWDMGKSPIACRYFALFLWF